jgi:hypothetical protein
MVGLVLLAVAGATASPDKALAQSAQPWSLQGSLLAASQEIGSSAISGIGFEGQFRYTPASLWSLGIGFQTSNHESGAESITITGVFLEPRYTLDLGLGGDRFAPYLAGRLALLRQSATLFQDPESPTVLLEVSSGGSAFGAGAGLLIRGTERVNLDFGAAFVSQAFSDATSQGTTFSFARFTGYVAKAGVSVGFGSR